LKSTYAQILSLSKEEGLNELQAENQTYLINKIGLEEQKNAKSYLLLYDDAPAIRAEVQGIIIKVNGVRIVDWNLLVKSFQSIIQEKYHSHHPRG